jgi:hypothetical protein
MTNEMTALPERSPGKSGEASAAKKRNKHRHFLHARRSLLVKPPKADIG